MRRFIIGHMERKEPYIMKAKCVRTLRKRLDDKEFLIEELKDGKKDKISQIT